VKKWAIAFQTVFVFASVAAEWGREAALGNSATPLTYVWQYSGL
jgi:hypothetical protein